MRRARIAVQERHGDGLGTPEPARQPRQLGGVQWLELIAHVVEPPRDTDAILSVDEGRWAVTRQCVELRPVLPADLDDVFKPSVRDQQYPRSVSLQERVRGNGESEDQPIPLGDLSVKDPSDALEHGRTRIGRGRGYLEHLQSPIPEQQEIGEGPSRVHGQNRR